MACITLDFFPRPKVTTLNPDACWARLAVVLLLICLSLTVCVCCVAFVLSVADYLLRLN